MTYDGLLTDSLCSTRNSASAPSTASAMVLEEDPLLTKLTPQERRILDLVADGQTNRQIAATLFLAEKTVKNYVSNLLAKLGMERRTQAASYATRINERSAQTRRTDATGT